eukprot:2982159-Amphidinium_carterae.1
MKALCLPYREAAGTALDAVLAPLHAPAQPGTKQERWPTPAAGACGSTAGSRHTRHLGQVLMVSAPCACPDQGTSLALGMLGQTGPARPPSHPPS